MNKEANDEQAKGAVATGGKKVFREPQLKVYGRVSDLTRIVRDPKVTPDSAGGTKSGL